MGSFEKSLQKFGKKVVENHEKVKRMASFDLFASIVLATPVDKGTLRGNWFASIGVGSDFKSEKTDEAGTDTNRNIESVLELTSADQDVFLTNNLPYATRIEYDGWSSQAEKGMVRVNTMRWN